MSNQFKKTQNHPFHLVDPSPWPIFASLSCLILTFGGVIYIHNFIGGNYILTLGFVIVLFTIAVWWRDVVREGTFQGHHTEAVVRGLRYGIILFIASEVIFFVAFFWAFFHSALVPTIEVGSVWPPLGIQVIDAYDVPLLNTLILLTSGATLTWAHHAIVAGKNEQTVYGLIATIVLAIIFTSLQVIEYSEAPFSINDGIYGTTFYLATGFHGAHVLIGTIFLTVCLVRQIKGHFTRHHHVGFEAAAWYWHFVDVVWLILYLFIYCWGSI